MTITSTTVKTKPEGSLSAHAYSALKVKILNHTIKTGRYYLERELEELLGFSRTPIKEALVRLENEGLIHIQPRHGIRVKAISADDMAEIYQVITCLECEAVEELAQKGMTEEEIASINNACTEMETALANDDLETWAAADERFHKYLLDFCGNKRLKQTVLNFWDQSHRARYMTLPFREKPTHSTEDHINVVAAIMNGEKDKASQIHREHRRKGAEVLVHIIRTLDQV